MSPDASLANGFRNLMHEKQQIQLSVLTPVHIGTRGGKLTALEFMVGDGRVHLIDENKLGNFLKDKNLIDYFVREVGKGPFRMERFLREKGRFQFPKDLSQVSSLSVSGGNSEMQDFRPFTRDGMGQIYLPGSSVKGVFRTALLYRILKQAKTVLDKVNEAIKRESQYLGKRKKFFSARFLQEDRLQKFELPGGKYGPNEDILRCFSVRDSYPIGEVKTQVLCIRFLSRSSDGHQYWSQQKRGERKDLSVWVEALTAGTFAVELSWDQGLYTEFKKKNTPPVSNINDLLNAVTEMNQDLVQSEIAHYTGRSAKIPPGMNYKEILQKMDMVRDDATMAADSVRKWYGQRPNSLFRIGFGTGMLSTTVGLCLPPELRQKIRDACGSDPRPGDPAPKSRRVWKKNETEYLPMGWLSVKPQEKK